MIFIVNDHSYKVGREEMRKTLRMIKQKHKKENIIYAVVKNGVCEARKDRYNTPLELLKEVQEWMDKGYKVHYNRALI